MSNRFDRDTAVERLGEGSFSARIDPGWWIHLGPNGGYVAAILLRALEQEVGDPARSARSLTVHFTEPPREGPVRIETRLERAGRSLSTATARLIQGDRLLALAIAAFSRARAAPEVQLAAMPEVSPPEKIEPWELDAAISIRERYEYRRAIGEPPGSGAPRAVGGGWIRTAEPRIVDAKLGTAFCDAWPPAVFSHLTPGEAVGPLPTVDLTIHFRTALPLPGAEPGDFVLAAFETRLARQGFLEEDGEIWSRDGVLLAQSRQLAALMPPRR